VSGDVTAANLRAGMSATSRRMLPTTTSGWMLPATSASLLGECRKRQNQKNCKQTR
jgi:hypothetical protein